MFEVKCSIRESDICLEDGKREGFNVIFSVKYYDIKLFVIWGGGGRVIKRYMDKFIIFVIL